ncbi:transcriptional repressor [Gordonia phage Gsput1]|uniref:DNA binding protein n=1 Tax=Gordonia phage Gsput1 TaxID=1622193 RepID=A0A0E3XB64_9CAUD|nr:transcriptional repressor [Gordonia phage Gsput1]AKC03057.1 DNA binding protein [Gordonia phage Gsput1]
MTCIVLIVTNAATIEIDYDEVLNGMRRNNIANLTVLAEDVIGVSLSTLNRQLCGRSAPTSFVIAGLASRLGIRLDRLLIVRDPHAPTLRQAS